MSIAPIRLIRLASRILPLAMVPCAVFAFWDNFFDPLAIKELFVLSMGMLAFLSWWTAGGMAHSADGSSNPLSRPLAYMLLWSLLTLCWTGPQALALHHWSCFAALLLTLPPLFDFGKDPVYRKTCRNLFLVIGTILLVLAAFQLNGISLGGLLRVAGGNSRTRVSLTIGHNNGVAPIILLTSFLALGAMAETRRRIYRLALWLTVLSCWILIVFFLLTRSTLIGLFLGGVLLIVLNLYRLRVVRNRHPGRGVPIWAKRALVGGLALLVALVCVAGFWVVRGGSIEGTYNPNLARNLTDRLRTLNPQFLMVDSRARLWAIGAVMMRHHPLLGLGFSSAKYDYPFYQALFYEYHPDYPSRPTPLHSEQLHNDYLQWMAETGAIGTVLLVWSLMVFGKTVLLWLKSARKRSAPDWFGGSCLLVAIVVLLLDGCFSFPGHIAPIAIYFPGLILLWLSYSVRNTGRERRPIVSSARRTPAPYAFPARLALAGLFWSAFALPFGMSEEKAPYIARTGVWSPLMAQIYGRYFHGRMSSVNDEFRSLLADTAARLREGPPLSREELSFTLEANREVRDQFLEFPSMIPFAGDAIYHAGSAVETIHSFYAASRNDLLRTVRAYGTGSPESQLLRKELEASTGFLPMAEDLFQQSLKNYRYHDLFRRIGRVQIELTARSSFPSPEARRDLVRSGRWALETARRIYYTDDTLFAEIQVAIQEGDPEAADKLVSKLVQLGPYYIRYEVLPGLAKRGVRVDQNTGRKTLDLFSQEFLKLLLPHLTPSHADIYGVAFTILDGAGSREVIEAYAGESDRLQPPYNRLFVEFRMLGRKSQFEDLEEELDNYDRYQKEDETFGPDQRIFYLSELQKFSQAGPLPERWKAAVRSLFELQDRPLAQAVAHRMLAEADWEEGNLLEGWRGHLQAQAKTNLAYLEFVYDRRANSLDHAFLGMGWPVFPP